MKRHCFPVYWDGENRRVLRGHWFARKGGVDWLPIREDVSEQLEIAYRSKVCRILRFVTFIYMVYSLCSWYSSSSFICQSVLTA